jgi:hypothetical protein
MFKHFLISILGETYKDIKSSWAPVADICNPSYSGDRNQEDRSSKPAWSNSLQDPISKNSSHKRAGGVAQSKGPEFKPWYQKEEGGRRGVAQAMCTHVSKCKNNKNLK